MKKKIDVDLFASNLRGESVFFPAREGKPSPEQAGEPKEEQNTSGEAILSTTEPLKEIAEEHPTTNNNASMQAGEKASIDASKHASTPAENPNLEGIRKTLKLVGKEVLYVRLTPEEKKQVGDIEYTYQQQGIKTSGNEIGRIALNFLLVEYKEHGEQSILAKLLAALHT